MRELPRLAVVSDVVPTRTQGGELLLYRLLEDYPVDRLRVVHGGKSPYFDPAKVLPGVRHDLVEYSYTLPAPLRSRWVPFWRAVELGRMGRHSGRVADLLADFHPEAVLTVTDYGLWRTAATYTRRTRLPLYLVQHDDLASKLSGNSPKVQHRLTRWLLDRQVGRIYRQAISRFCVSPGMSDRYRAKFGASSDVVYPSRGEDSPEPRVRVRPSCGGPPRIAFAGALYTEGGRDLLRRLAGILLGLGGRLDLYTRDDVRVLERYGLDLPNVRLVGFFPPKEMAERMAMSAHALFLPASFLSNEAFDVATLFPSKLADYTAIGLPLLTWGPDYSSAVRWVKANPEVGEPLTASESEPVREAITRLASDPSYAAHKAAAAIEAGGRDFSAEAARRVLTEALAVGRGGRDRSRLETSTTAPWTTSQ